MAVEEGWPSSGVGSEICTVVSELAFDDLDAAPARVTGAEVPTPYAANLEAMVFPTVGDIVAKVKQTLGKE